MYGYVGKILRVNLTDKKFSTVSTDKYVPKYIGGRGVATRIYFEEIPPEVEAFDTENKLIFMTGPIQGVPFPGAGRMCVVGKSAENFPVETIMASKAGGWFPAEMKFAGYDGLIIEGKAETPVYLWINDEHVELVPAQGLWGYDTRETQKLLWRRHGSRTVIAAIGQASENMARTGCIITDSGSGFGKGGYGGIMGSKKLKAIVIRGTGGVAIADPKGLLELRKQADRYSGVLREPTVGYGGTKYPATVFSPVGSLSSPISTSMAPTTVLSGTKLADMAQSQLIQLRKGSCYGCNKQCRTTLKFLDNSLPGGATMCQEGYFWDAYEWNYYGGRPRGPVAWQATMLANQFTIDAVDLNHPSGYAHAREWMWQAMKDGILTDANTGWTLKEWGSKDMTVQALSDIAYRRNFGAIRAEGGLRAAHIVAATARFGANRRNVLNDAHVNFPIGGKMGGHNEHWTYGTGDSYIGFPNIANTAIDQREPHDNHTYDMAYVARGAGTNTPNSAWAREVAARLLEWAGTDKPVVEPQIEEAEKATRWFVRCKWEDESLMLCDWSTSMGAHIRGYSTYVEDGNADMEIGSKVFTAVTGIKKTERELYEEYDRLWTLERAIACREGRWALDDDFSDQFYASPCQYRGNTPDRFGGRTALKGILTKLYTLAGWDEYGIPTKERLRALGLEDVATDLEKRGVYW